MTNSCTLTELLPGQTATIVEVGGDDPLVSSRLSHLGFLPGTKIKAIKRAPLGDPTVFELRGNQMSLRKAESGRILIKIEEQK